MKRLLALALAAVLTLSAQAQETDMTERQALEALLGGEPVTEELFAPSFLEALPLAQIQPILEQVRTALGEEIAITGEAGEYVARGETLEQPIQIALDGEGRIVGLYFLPPVSTGGTLEETLARADALPGEVSYLVIRDGEVLAARNETEPLAVGSAFKLGIAALLGEAVAEERLAWDDVAVLTEDNVSLPSGMLQTFPVGAPVTLHTAAALMISISDNTATDMLVDVVGRAALAERLGIDFSLKTREFFYLKADGALRQRFVEADPGEKAEIVAQIAASPLPPIGPNLPLHDPGLEWYIPATRLCELIESVADLEVLQINPGIARPADWAEIAFKGGSETGVLNLTTHVRDAAGVASCVVLTINAEADIEPLEATGIYGSILAHLASL